MEYYKLIFECRLARLGSIEKESESLTEAIRLFNNYQGGRIIERPDISVMEGDGSVFISLKLKKNEFDDDSTVSILQEEFRNILRRRGHL